jgi:two-component system chemotaxis response regulator CheB
VHSAGGVVCAQDEASCAVFGMPRAAIEAGVVDLILPLAAIPRRIADAVAAS